MSLSDPIPHSKRMKSLPLSDKKQKLSELVYTKFYVFGAMPPDTENGEGQQGRGETVGGGDDDSETEPSAVSSDIAPSCRFEGGLCPLLSTSPPRKHT